MIPTHGGDLVHYLCFKKAVPDAESQWKFEKGEVRLRIYLCV